VAEAVYRSTIAQGLFYVDGKPLSLADYPMFEAVYDGQYSRILLKTARQVSKSTTLAAFMIAEAIAVVPFKSYYVSPTQEQTRKFSHTRAAKILAYSPDVRKKYIGPESIDNVYLRILKNGSEMAFTYAMDDPDRARGYSADRTCFDATAEVLTRVGWKLVRALTPTDEVGVLAPDGALEWHRPTRLIQFRHKGSMVCFTHHGVSLRVTSNHKMWVNFRVKTSPTFKTPDVWEFVEAGSLANTTRMGFKFTGRAVLRGSQVPQVKVLEGGEGYEVSRRSLSIPFLEFAELVGWYLSEGSIVWKMLNGRRQARGGAGVFSNGFAPRRAPKGVSIVQCPGPHADRIKRCLRACGLVFSAHPTEYQTSRGARLTHAYVVTSAQLGSYFEGQGLCRDKHIPEEFFEHPAALTRLLESLHFGDATMRDGTLRTRSKRLADDVHRAWTLLGRSSAIHTRMMAPRPGAPLEPLYEVQAFKYDYHVFWRPEFESKKRVVVEQVVDEDVFCFTVKHHRPIVRGGFGQRPIVTGQCFDEVQDMVFEAVIPVIEECMAASKYQYSSYCGTPKTMENTIEVLWGLSSQTEWCMRCDACSKWTFVASTKAIGKKGLICLSCGGLLNPRNGKWIDMASGQGIKGFHISQAIMPTNVPAAWQPGTEGYDVAVDRWEKLLYKMESPLYGESKFLNECIGVSTSTGVRLLTKEILEALCDDKLAITRLPTPTSLQGIVRVVAGVDWSGGGGEVKGSEGLYKSRTVFHVWGQQPDGRLRTLTSKVFPNGHATGWIDEIVELCNAWGVQMVGCDAGEGALANSFLRQRLGDQRVLAFKYQMMSKPLEWNPAALTYNVDKTTMVDTYARMLLHKQVVYPNLRDAKVAIDDILNVYEEITPRGMRVWKHSPVMPDDSLHAQIFAWLAWGVLSGNLKFN